MKLILIFILPMLSFYILRLCFQKGKINFYCPACKAKIKPKNYKKGILFFGLVNKPFSCPNCGLALIWQEQSHSLTIYSWLIFIIALIIQFILKRLDVSEGFPVINIIKLIAGVGIVFGLAMWKFVPSKKISA